MTPAQINNLARLVSDSDFISILTANRPPLSGETHEAVNLNAARADGWERCIQKIIAMTAQEQTPARNSYVDTSKLD